MLIKTFVQRSLIFCSHKSLLTRSAVAFINSPQTNSHCDFYFARSNFCMSSKKKTRQKRSSKQVPVQNSRQQSVDLNSAPISQQIHMLK